MKGEYALSSWAISNPTFIKKEGTVRITAILWESDKEYELWYEVPDSIERYLFSDCLDAFLVAVLPIVSMKGCNLELKGCVSEKLYHSLLDNVIPLLSNNTDIYHPIKLVANKLFAPDCCHGHVGTGLSCGVDSFYTILSLSQKHDETPLDVLTFFNVGSHRSTSGFGDEESRRLFQQRLDMNMKCAEELGLPLLVVDSNIGEYLCRHQVPFALVHAFCSLSAVLACGSYFNRYYYASGQTKYDPSRLNKATGFVESKLCPWLSTEYVDLASYGGDKTRLQKLQDIVDYPLVQKHLNVCWRELKNCGECPKCIRTLMELYLLGKVDKYGSVFDLHEFYEHFDEYKESIYKWADKDEYSREIVEEFEKRSSYRESTPSQEICWGKKLWKEIFKKS
ncbi:MAG: hypothetical protein J6D29_05090 [Solobacterium sp.]|nr:hypothetical protein [Solobacterium sp.]